MLSKQKIHKAYLLLSAIVVLHGTLLTMIDDGQWNIDRLRYYTVISNLLVAVGFLLILVLYNSKGALRYYISYSMLICIALTALTYNGILVPLAGANIFFSDYPNFATHLFSALLVFINYLAFEQKGMFTFKHILAGAVVPALYYVVFVSIGPIIDFYPYFFMAPPLIGWPMVFVWFGCITIGLFILSFLLVLFDKGLGKKHTVRSL